MADTLPVTRSSNETINRSYIYLHTDYQQNCLMTDKNNITVRVISTTTAWVKLTTVRAKLTNCQF